MTKTSILLADDHRMVREGLRLLIDSQPDMRVVGEAGNGNEVLAKAVELGAELVVMDLSMPELNGLQATQLLKVQCPRVKVIALTVHEDEGYLLQLCRAGASGYVLKRSAADELIQAIRKVIAGEFYFDPTVLSRALVAKTGEPPAPGHEFAPVVLSHREKEVLVLLAWGRSNKEVAGQLGLSPKTVETYRLRIGEKLGLRSRTEMVRYALRQGWLDEARPLELPL